METLAGQVEGHTRNCIGEIRHHINFRYHAARPLPPSPRRQRPGCSHCHHCTTTVCHHFLQPSCVSQRASAETLRVAPLAGSDHAGKAVRTLKLVAADTRPLDVFPCARPSSVCLWLCLCERCRRRGASGLTISCVAAGVGRIGHCHATATQVRAARDGGDGLAHQRLPTGVRRGHARPLAWPPAWAPAPSRPTDCAAAAQPAGTPLRGCVCAASVRIEPRARTCSRMRSECDVNAMLAPERESARAGGRG
jgi:hypothetical protein